MPPRRLNKMDCRFYLVISAWVAHNKQAWFPESSLNLISELSWSETACYRSGPSMVCKLQNSTLSNTETISNHLVN